MWAYQTTKKTPTGQTPFSLTYGLEAIVPVEMTVPTRRISQYDVSQNEAGQTVALELIDKHRNRAELRNEAYKRNVAKYHDRHVQLKTFKNGSLVL